MTGRKVDTTQDQPSSDGEAELALVAAARAGCRESLGLLFERYKNPVFTFLRRLVGSNHTAEDLLQETFVKAIDSLAGFRSDGAFGGWVFRIAHNQARDHLRREGQRGRVEGAAAPRLSGPTPDAEAAAVRREALDRLERFLDDLPAEQREVFLLRMHTPMSFNEIAEATGVTRSTAISRMHYAVTKLREALGAGVEVGR